jgi:ABC-type phosphate/phosphonate transport system ATPase subunit
MNIKIDTSNMNIKLQADIDTDMVQVIGNSGIGKSYFVDLLHEVCDITRGDKEEYPIINKETGGVFKCNLLKSAFF